MQFISFPVRSYRIWKKNKFKQWRHLVLLSYQGYKKSISKKTGFLITVIIWHAPKIPRFFVCQNLVSAKTVIPILIRNNNPMKEICSYKTYEGSWKCNLFQASVRSCRIRKKQVKTIGSILCCWVIKDIKKACQRKPFFL